MRWAGWVLLVLAASGCVCACKVKPQFVFDCGDGRTARIEYRDKSRLMLMEYEGEVFRLPRAPSASGARYSDGRVTFWEKGGTAFIEREGKVVEEKCVLQVREKP